MKKTTAAAVAAAVGAVLLLGGAGTLAYWSDTTQSETTAISSGQLDLQAVQPGTWTVTNGASVDVPLTGDAVPGDILTSKFNVPVTLEGQNMQADLTVTPSVPTITPVAGTTTVDGAVLAQYMQLKLEGFDANQKSTGVTSGPLTATTLSKITPSTVTVKVSVTVAFPFDTDFKQDAMNRTLQAITMNYSLVQVRKA